MLLSVKGTIKIRYGPRANQWPWNSPARYACIFKLIRVGCKMILLCVQALSYLFFAGNKKMAKSQEDGWAKGDDVKGDAGGLAWGQCREVQNKRKAKLAVEGTSGPLRRERRTPALHPWLWKHLRKPNTHTESIFTSSFVQETFYFIDDKCMFLKNESTHSSSSQMIPIWIFNAWHIITYSGLLSDTNM